MERKIVNKLIEWKNSSKRMPLLIYGARQVGKTNSAYLLVSTTIKTRCISIWRDPLNSYPFSREI